MIIRDQGQQYVFDGVTYEIGMRIIGSKMSDYKGVNGRIIEIRTGDDKETENDPDYPDIYCAFDVPASPFTRSALEKHFTSLYGCEKTIEDIIFDFVIMAPEEIVIPGTTSGTSVFVLMKVWNGHEGGIGLVHTQSAVFHSQLEAKAEFEIWLQNEMEASKESGEERAEITYSVWNPVDGSFELKRADGSFFYLQVSQAVDLIGTRYNVTHIPRSLEDFECDRHRFSFWYAGKAREACCYGAVDVHFDGNDIPVQVHCDVQNEIFRQIDKNESNWAVPEGAQEIADAYCEDEFWSDEEEEE